MRDFSAAVPGITIHTVRGVGNRTEAPFDGTGVCVRDLCATHAVSAPTSSTAPAVVLRNRITFSQARVRTSIQLSFPAVIFTVAGLRNLGENNSLLFDLLFIHEAMPLRDQRLPIRFWRSHTVPCAVSL